MQDRRRTFQIVLGNRRWTFALLALTLTAVGCGPKRIKVAKPPKVGTVETGIASWYGYPYHGRRAANGEIYDMEKLTAAHRTYPFDTWVRVLNLSNDKTVDVRIQDRGPFIRGRIIDLSHAAAQQIDLIGPGITKVRMIVIPPPTDLPAVSEKQTVIPPPTDLPAVREKQLDLFAVQIGAFKDRTRAVTLADEMRPRFGAARVVERAAAPPMFRVLIGEYETAAQAEEAAAQIRAAGGAGLVVRLDEPR